MLNLLLLAETSHLCKIKINRIFSNFAYFGALLWSKYLRMRKKSTFFVNYKPLAIEKNLQNAICVVTSTLTLIWKVPIFLLILLIFADVSTKKWRQPKYFWKVLIQGNVWAKFQLSSTFGSKINQGGIFTLPQAISVYIK